MQEDKEGKKTWQRLPGKLEVEVNRTSTPEKGIRETLEAWKVNKCTNDLNLSNLLDVLEEVGFSESKGTVQI